MLTIIKKGTSKKEIRKKLQAVTSRLSERDILPYAGRLKGSKNPLEYQTEMRNEWE